jgi:c-di-GMP-binding flagellar brake protein YcgR
MEEHREYVRVQEKANISYFVIPFTESKRHITSDISQGGIRFFIHDFVPRGSHLKVRMDFSKSNVTIEATVRLVWIKKSLHDTVYEVGVNFIDISSKAADHLTEYISSLLDMKSDMGWEPV